MAKIPFNVDAYTARLIGRENVSKLEGAVIELIKNTYDADATCCILYYDEKHKILYLADNGCGMTEQTIRNHWMTIGRSSKKRTYISGGGRIQTGEKGIGRFALDRIADRCQMLTGTVSSGMKLLWTVDWSSFAGGRNITDISADLEETTISFKEFLEGCSNRNVISLVKKYWKYQGTVFKITDLREEWNEELLHNIRENLASLIPYELSSVYKIYCFGNQDTCESAEVFSNVDAFSYDYKIEFKVAASESPADAVKTKLWRAEYDFGSDEDTILKDIGLFDQKKYFHGLPIEKNCSFEEILSGVDEELRKSIGQFGGVLYFSKRTTTPRDRERFYQKDITGRKDVRDTFGGIKIYRDNFRVRPYGDPKSSSYDWLQLARRKNASPAGVASKGQWCVSADQMLGSVFISRVNVSLPDQSNREGIVETKEFLLLQEFIKGILKLLEKDRQYIFRILAEYYKSKHPSEAIQEDINRKAAEQQKENKQAENHVDNTETETSKTNTSIPNKYAVDPEDAKIALDAKDEQIEELENELKMLRVLATTGIVTNTYIHEFKTLSHRLSMKIIMAKEAIDKYQDMGEASDYINQANVIREAFNSWFQVTIDAVKKDKRRRRKINLINLISDSVVSWNKTLQSKHIEVILKNDKQCEVFLRCFPYEIDIIINNLIANSTASFDRMRTTERKIYINIAEAENYICIDYSDTGIGLAPVYKKNPELTLEVFETDKRDTAGQKIGTGMGLWIVNNTVREYNGWIDLSKNVTMETGYYARIYLKKQEA